jgi:hypothetical protein
VVQGAEYATAVGLVRHGLRSGAASGAVSVTGGGAAPQHRGQAGQGGEGGLMGNLKRLFKDYF